MLVFYHTTVYHTIIYYAMPALYERGVNLYTPEALFSARALASPHGSERIWPEKPCPRPERDPFFFSGLQALVWIFSPGLQALVWIFFLVGPSCPSFEKLGI